MFKVDNITFLHANLKEYHTVIKYYLCHGLKNVVAVLKFLM